MLKTATKTKQHTGNIISVIVGILVVLGIIGGAFAAAVVTSRENVDFSDVVTGEELEAVKVVFEIKEKRVGSIYKEDQPTIRGIVTEYCHDVRMNGKCKYIGEKTFVTSEKEDPISGEKTKHANVLWVDKNNRKLYDINYSYFPYFGESPVLAQIRSTQYQRSGEPTGRVLLEGEALQEEFFEGDGTGVVSEFTLVRLAKLLDGIEKISELEAGEPNLGMLDLIPINNNTAVSRLTGRHFMFTLAPTPALQSYSAFSSEEFLTNTEELAVAKIFPREFSRNDTVVKRIIRSDFATEIQYWGSRRSRTELIGINHVVTTTGGQEHNLWSDAKGKFVGGTFQERDVVQGSRVQIIASKGKNMLRAFFPVEMFYSAEDISIDEFMLFVNDLPKIPRAGTRWSRATYLSGNLEGENPSYTLKLDSPGTSEVTEITCEHPRGASRPPKCN